MSDADSPTEVIDRYLEEMLRYKTACRVHLKTVMSEKECDEELLGKLCEVYALIYGNIKVLESVEREGLTKQHSAALLASVTTLTILMHEVKQTYNLSFTFH